MRRHELKILPKWYEDVESSKKNFEIRRNDRDFKVGDTLVLQEYKEGSYTGRQITRKIQYIYQGNGDYGLSEGYCILGLEQEPICIAKVEFDEDKLQEIVKEQVARIEITTERESSGDLISRQAAIMAMNELHVTDRDVYEMELSKCFDNDRANGKLLSLPLVQPTSGWIPVSERLPEKNIWVLVTVEQSGNRYQEIMRRNKYIEAWTDDIDNYTDEITAWMPLPKPYKAESEVS